MGWTTLGGFQVAPFPGTGVCTGKVTCCQRGFNLRGFTFLRVTPTESQGSPNHSLLPSGLGKGSVEVAGGGDGNLQPFP